MKSGTSFLSQSEYILHFGLGKNKKIDKIKIKWPSGTVQEIENVNAKQELVIEEPLE